MSVGSLNESIGGGASRRLRRRLGAASPGSTMIEMLDILTIISKILSLVGPRVLS